MGWEVPSGGTAALCWKPQLRTRIPGLSKAVAEGGMLALLLLWVSPLCGELAAGQSRLPP